MAQPEAVGQVDRTKDVVSWTLERTLARAMESNPDIQVAKHEFERQTGARWQVRARLLPSVTASGSGSRRQPVLVDFDPKNLSDNRTPGELTKGTALARYDVRVEVRQLVFDGLSSWHQYQRQKLLENQSLLILQETAMRVAGTARQAFDAVLMRNAVAAAERRRVEEFAQVVAWTERKHAAGEIPQFELLRAESELQGARAELAESERLLGQAEQGFRRLLLLPDVEGAISVQGEFQARHFDLPLEEAVRRARVNRPDLAAAELALKAARRDQQSLVGAYLPKVEVFAGYGASSSYYDSERLLRGWTVGATGVWYLFDGGANRGRRITLRAERRTAETKLEQLQHEITSKLHELYQSLAQTKVSLESQSKSVDLAARALRDARRLYEVGQASLEQVLQAEMTHRRASSRMSEAIYNFNALVGEIELSVGGNLSDSLVTPDTWKP